MSNNTKKRTAVVGYGSMGSWHIRHIQSSDVVQPAGIYDIRSERCALASENHIHVYSSLEELLADNTVDIVVIATPNDLHKPQTIAALSAGKHVICEKPVTVSSADLKDMIDASTKYQRLFTVHQNRRWDCDYLMIKQVYAEGLLGEVTSIESRIHGSRGIPGDWRGQREHGGGMLLDWGVHLIDQMLGIVFDRRIERLYCRLSHITNHEVDDGFRLELYFEGGLVALIEVGTSNFISMPRFYITGTDGSAIIGDWRDECRVVSCRNRDEQNVTPVITAAGITRTMAPRDERTLAERFIPRPESDVHNFYRNFVAAIDGREKQIVTHPQVMRVMKIMEAAFESDRLRRPIDFSDC
jgi:predicted dehydrogenase